MASFLVYRRGPRHLFRCAGFFFLAATPDASGYAHAAAAAASYRLDKKELRRAVRSLGYYATTEDINEFFRMCDFSGDGMIDFAEMKRALNAFLKGQALSPRQPASAKRVSAARGTDTDARAAFDPLDFDWPEFSAHFPTGTDPDSITRRRKLWRACDINGNGLISLAEWDRGLQELCGRSLAGSTMARAYQAKPAIARAFHAAHRLDQRGERATRRQDSTELAASLRDSAGGKAALLDARGPCCARTAAHRCVSMPFHVSLFTFVYICMCTACVTAWRSAHTLRQVAFAFLHACIHIISCVSHYAISLCYLINNDY